MAHLEGGILACASPIDWADLVAPLSPLERADIVRHLDMVDAVISWDDADDSACGAIEKCLEISQTVVFCNGGDRAKGNTPELDKFGNNDRVKFEWAVGGTEKMNSSSWILHGYFERQRKLLGI